MKTMNFRGDLTDNSAKKEALDITMSALPSDVSGLCVPKGLDQ